MFEREASIGDDHPTGGKSAACSEENRHAMTAPAHYCDFAREMGGSSAAHIVKYPSVAMAGGVNLFTRESHSDVGARNLH